MSSAVSSHCAEAAPAGKGLSRDASRADQPTVAFAHLGCEKNRVDTEHMLGLLEAAGYGVTSDTSSADLVVVNTCSFIQDAREASVRTLVGLAEDGKQLVIAGCLAQHFQAELLEAIPEARAVVGSGDYQHIASVLERVAAGERVNQVSAAPSFLADEHLPRRRTTAAAVAYLKVAEGCNYRCSFCIIPKLRGNQRSRSIPSIVAEAQQLAAEGVQELILISQITTNYGQDLYGQPMLAELLRALGTVSIPWIRVHYAYPTGLTPAVLAAFREVPNVLPYLDLPLQHSHPEVLRAMNRPWQADVNEAVLQRIRDQLPDATIRTTLIVGYPGESDAHFAHLEAFVQQQRFDHVGVFEFSPEAGTAAASQPDPVPEAVAQARRDRLMQLQQPIAAARNQAWVGRVVPVLVEAEAAAEQGCDGEKRGRCSRFAPDVDGIVRLHGPAPIGQMVTARITAADIYDLDAMVVQE